MGIHRKINSTQRGSSGFGVLEVINIFTGCVFCIYILASLIGCGIKKVMINSVFKKFKY